MDIRDYNKPNKLFREKTTLEDVILKPKKIKNQLPMRGRKTKIICTIGPVTQSISKLSELMQAGMNVARMNFSHGTHEYHLKTIKNVREASKMTSLPCAILLDTKGPEIRTGMLEGGKPVILKENTEVTIVCTKDPDFRGNETKFSVDHLKMTEVLKVGTIIKIDDGLILIKVKKLTKQTIIGTVLNTSELGQKKGVNLPGIDIGLPSITDKDKEDLKFGVKNKVDIIAPSFINCAQDIIQIRSVLGEEGKNIKIISKIESVKGLLNFDEILKVSDGIMVARGDLGVEIQIQKVCLAQKTMIRKCNAVGKPVVTATQMLDSMIKNSNPTRAEVSDVANAVFDGSDCVMLSGETAKGSYPVESVSVMSRICYNSENAFNYDKLFMNILSISNRECVTEDKRTEAVTSAAVKIAIDMNAALIFALTDSGRTAGFVSKYRPPVQIICVTPNKLTVNQALIRSGLWPIIVDENLTDDNRYKEALKIATSKGWCVKGDCVVVVSGKQGVSGSSHKLNVVDVM